MKDVAARLLFVAGIVFLLFGVSMIAQGLDERSSSTIAYKKQCESAGGYPQRIGGRWVCSLIKEKP